MEGSSVALLILMLALAASSLVALLQQRHPRPRADWQLIVVALKGHNSDEARLALTTYDVSLAGFANRTHHWHAFPGHDHLLPTSTPLPFGNSYRDLIGGLANLPGLPLGRAPTLQAVRALSAYDPATADHDDVETLKRALATLTVTTSEAQRLTPIKETVGKGWESGEARVAPEHLPYIEHWDTMCYELIRANRTGAWDGPFTELLKESASIHSTEEALAVVNVIVNRTMADLLMAHARSA
ncbi:uncharacterized protein LOC133923392 [Phragmites australis]|uniref:uncharacterized protein LOC133923392 n=1 Tax=Phragmites australis TaxID=29695 RepID=UPI002D773A02|nr:uncharacterized protein LOC133923392 [Phragmites australis]